MVVQDGENGNYDDHDDEKEVDHDNNDGDTRW